MEEEQRQPPPDLYYHVAQPMLPVDEADATLVLADINVPPEESLAGYGIPHVVRCPDSRITEYMFETVTHVCLKAYYSEQAKILARVGVRWSWDYPYIFWHFLIRIVSQSLFGNEDELTLLNTTVNGDRELLNLSTRKFLEGEVVRIKVVEVSLGWAEGEDPLTDVLRAFWKPARPDIVNDINWRVREQAAAVLLAANQAAYAEASVTGGLVQEEQQQHTDAAVLALQEAEAPLAPFPRSRMMIVTARGRFYSVYYSPGENKCIPIHN